MDKRKDTSEYLLQKIVDGCFMKPRRDGSYPGRNEQRYL